MNDFSPNSAILRRAVLSVIGICVEFMHQSNVNPLLREACEPAVPLSVLEFSIKLIEHGRGELRVPLRKDILEMNIVLVSVLSDL